MTIENIFNHQKPVIIITGPTASGKTTLSFQLADVLPLEIINADMGQLYQPLTIGTAKPDWINAHVPCHLFDIVDTPVDFNSYSYRLAALEKIAAIRERNHIPTFVGGSLFYLKSLYYEPSPESRSARSRNFEHLSLEEKRDLLESIDPERAQNINKNDQYRIERALDVWASTGKKPSQLAPICCPMFNSLIIALVPNRDELTKQIKQRTKEMLSLGLIEETQALIGSPWEEFLNSKGIIGYREVLSWIKAGLNPKKLEEVRQNIDQKTRNYAKRQVTFLKYFLRLISKECPTKNYYTDVILIDKADKKAVDRVLDWGTSKGLLN